MSNETTVNALPEKVAAALERVEKYYVGIVPWFANVFDPKTGGFYMTVSGAKDPEMAPAIEMTCWGVNFLKTYTRAFETMPDKFRDGIIKFMNDRQDPETGMYIDFQGPVNPRETARNQGAALRALDHFGADTRYPHPRRMGASAGKTPVMPEYMDSVDSYMAWVTEKNWDHASWSAGDQTQSSLQYVNMLEPERREKYVEALFKFLDERQQESGLWATDMDFNAASGAFKVGLVYAACGRRLPNPEKIVDAIFECYRVSKTSNPFFVRNPISVLHQMSTYSPELKKKIQDGIVENIDAVVESFGEFLCPDGAFSARKGKSMLAFGGVVGSHELFEGDIDATLMMLIARRTLYNIFDTEAPYFDTTDFWAWIYGEKEMPSIGE